MKQLKFLLVFVLCISLTAAFAANGVKSVSSNGKETILKFKITDYDYKKVNTPRGKAIELLVPKTGKLLLKGAPALPKMSASIIIPDKAKMKVEVIGTKFVDYKNVLVAPSKGNLMRTVNPDDVPYVFGKEYTTDGFFPKNLVELKTPHIVRNFRGQTVIVHPFRYNPTTKVLRVYTKVGVKVSTTGQTGKNVLVRNKALKKLDRSFKKVYAGHFVNFDQVQTRYTFVGDDIGNMLIVSHSSFMSDMADFVTWKQSCNYSVDLVDYSTIGSSSALETYVANYYNSNGLTFLLLIGDHAYVPTSSTSAGDSDNNYGYIVGSDSYLDILVGRFSAESSAHVLTQVDRTINYERDVLSSAAFFKNTVGMGTTEGPGHDDEYDYEHIDNIGADCESIGYTYTGCHQHTGSASLMSSLIDAGTGVIWYCGHGSVTQWYTSSWSYYSSNVDALTNEWELPFVISVACVVGDFTTNTCFCETWQRATNNGNPTGSIAHCGSTINQSWAPPMDAEDEMADLMVAGTVRTFGGMFANGLFKMIDINGSGGEDMADTWVCFGDPSVQMRTPIAPNGPISGGNIPPDADFSFTTNLLQAIFTDLSSDSDGTIVSWDWDFGDPGTSPAQNPMHTYAANGIYNVTLTVTDDEGATDSVTKPVSVSDGTEPEMYVYDISQSITQRGRNYNSTATVTIWDTDNNPVSGATVYITWSGVASGSASGVTGTNGTVSFTSPRIKSAGPFVITVDNVTHATLDYNYTLNNETSDSATY
ncbi:MAG: PKD domain-containing protein [Candidatus Aminicenantes bacterium]|nr:PKD domain-containing protein [Candidatus Aminicenantes bacterium]